MDLDHFIGFGQGRVAAASAARSTDHRAGFHGLDHLFAHQDRRLAPRDQGGGDDDVLFLMVRRSDRPAWPDTPATFPWHSRRRLSVLEFLRPSPRRRCRPRFHLFLGGGTHIGALTMAPSLLAVANSLKAGHAHTHHQHTRGSIVPAAVIIIGMARPNWAAASITACSREIGLGGQPHPSPGRGKCAAATPWRKR